MPRVTDDDVKAILPTSLEPYPFILAATVLVDTYLGTASTTLLTEVERWWAAHLVACADPTVHEKRLGQTTVVFDGAKLGEGLKSTRYGQQVLLLAPQLATITMKRATINVD